MIEHSEGDVTEGVVLIVWKRKTMGFYYQCRDPPVHHIALRMSRAMEAPS